jgi:hypothetical protein
VDATWHKVFTIDDWYDGPRSGATEINGAPYWYRSVYLDADWDPMEDRFELTPLTADLLACELERAAIFKRWDEARKNGLVLWNEGVEESFGALPNEMARNRELNTKMDSFVATSRPTLLARGDFDSGSELVQWKILDFLQSD